MTIMLCVAWSRNEKPCVNHWYRVLTGDRDYWKIKKDFHDVKHNITYYKIVTYYNGDNIYCGHSLARIREIMREQTWKVCIESEEIKDG